MENLLTVRQALKIHKVTRQGIYIAIRSNRLKAYRLESGWKIDPEDLAKFMNNRYNREFSYHEGEKKFDPLKGEVSIAEGAKLVGVPAQKLYYACNKGKINCIRKGKAIVIHIDELNRWKRTLMKKNKMRPLEKYLLY
jgi:hypothetical protein